ncbi:MAG TPA: DUF2127 domain-containing protein [Candidatus Paceibacterota bacterium]|nr:DUF2127 domain-containing protein [Candidatus Paceibacterota bacterium]
MNEPRAERELTDLFDLALFLKALGGAFEILGGIAIAFVPSAFVVRVADLVTAGELSGDPDDFVATHVRLLARAYALHAHDLLGLLLAIDGALKIVVVALVLKGYRFAYPLLILALGAIGSYEAYRAVATSNVLLAAAVVLDLSLIVLARHEYRLRYSSQV